METSEIVQVVETLHRDARERGLFFQYAQDDSLHARSVTIHDKPMISFGSCSYLGLEFHPALIQGVCDAVTRFGTQFSCSRGYLSVPLYDELEETFNRIFEAHVLVAPTTTLAHHAAFDVLMNEKDAIVLDHQVHQSVHQAAAVARTRGAHIAVIRHEEFERAHDVVAELAKRHRTVWFCMDGVLSMYGDLAPFAFLQSLVDIAPNVRLYIDDAHGMSWLGKYGRGSFLTHIPLSDRLVLASSLAKGFGCGGGLLVFSSKQEREKVRMCGGTLLFSGPIQPPMLGGALASAKIHLTSELVDLQNKLSERVLFANKLIKDAALPLLVENNVPIRFIRLGLPRIANEVAQRMSKDGFYVNVSMFPTVPMRRAGIRLSINANHELADIERMVQSLAQHVPAVLAAEGMSRVELDDMFANAVVSNVSAKKAEKQVAQKALPQGARSVSVDGVKLVVEQHQSIDNIDKTEWDSMLGHRAMISFEAMRLSEKIYQNQPKREHNWKFDYVIVRDENHKPVCATVFTTSLQKDDFLMRDEVSREVEKRRETDPYFLTSTIVMSGTTLSEGHHLYVDRQGPWRAAVKELISVAGQIFERENAQGIMFREVPKGDDEMDRFMLEQGFVTVPTLDSHVLPLNWKDEEDFAMHLSKYKRQDFRAQVKKAENYLVESFGKGSEQGNLLSESEINSLHESYRNLARRKFRINIFELPPNLLHEMQQSPAWEIVTLKLKPEAGGPADGHVIAWFAAHISGKDYGALVAGLDYDYVIEHGCYRQMLFQMIRQSKRRGARMLHMGMDADVEKSRYRTTPVQNNVYMQVRDHYNEALLREIVAEVAVKENGVQA